MALFPTFWELIIPNWNFTTQLGILLIAIAIAGMFLTGWLTGALKKLGVDTFLPRIWAIMLLVGVVLIWGFSILQDFVSTTAGAMIFWGTIVTVLIGILLFWQPKKKNGRNSKLTF